MSHRLRRVLPRPVAQGSESVSSSLRGGHALDSQSAPGGGESVCEVVRVLMGSDMRPLAPTGCPTAAFSGPALLLQEYVAAVSDCPPTADGQRIQARGRRSRAHRGLPDVRMEGFLVVRAFRTEGAFPNMPPSPSTAQAPCAPIVCPTACVCVCESGDARGSEHMSRPLRKMAFAGGRHVCVCAPTGLLLALSFFCVTEVVKRVC